MNLIYADYAATTPLDTRVLEAMMPYLTTVYFNAASSHAGGMQAQAAVMKARLDVARHIGAGFDEVFFTSGATEAINIAIQGCAAMQLRQGQRRKVVSLRSEHPAVRDAISRCGDEGFDIVWLPLDHDGRVVMEEAERLIDDQVLLVSIMMVNNETGVLQDLAALSALAHRHGAIFMTDATQAYGKVPIDVESLGIDIMTFSAHKIYGPKGAGALYVRRSIISAIRPLLVGGGQENGLRSGTHNVPGIVGLASAGSIAVAHMSEEAERIAGLRMKFEAALAAIPDVTINCQHVPRVSTISNVTFGECSAERLLASIPEVACSKGSACSSAKPTPSQTLIAMGRSEAQAHATVRFSFGRLTTEDEIDRLIHLVMTAANAQLVRSM